MSRTAAASTRRGLLSWKTKPRASAPASTAVVASSRFVIPQILIHVIKASRWSLVVGKNFKQPLRHIVDNIDSFAEDRGCFQQAAQSISRKGSLHERLADEESFVASRAKFSDVGAGADAALSDSQDAARKFCCQPERRVQVHLKSTQVARIHADEIAAGVECALEFFFVMGLAQHVEFVSAGF